MPQYWTDLVNRLTPYVPGEQRSGTGVIKLNTNENPYPPSDQVLAAINNVTADALRRYPDPQSADLRQALAQYHGVNLDQVFVGNGSDEILALAFMAFFKGKKPLTFPEISYSFYPVYCDLCNITAKMIPLNNDFSLSPDSLSGDCGGIIFPNPNAPTSMAVSKSDIEKLLQDNPNVVVLVDEAYADFGADSVIGLIKQYPNLVVSRTYSKGRSLAGLRIGAAFANANLIEGIRRVKDSFNSYPLDVIAQAAGVASIEDDAYYQKTTRKIIATRERTIELLKGLGYTVLPSSANFIFASPADKNAKRIFSELNKRNILVRYWEHEKLDQWLRITIGTDIEMDKLIQAIKDIS